MASRTVGTRLDQRTIDLLRSTAAVENRKASQIQAMALKSLLSLSPGARRAPFLPSTALQMSASAISQRRP
jgi:hypothetical protein